MFRTALAIVVFPAFGAAAFYGYLHVADIYWPLEVEEAAGPQAARFAGACLSGFMGLAVGGPVGLAILRGD